MNPASKTCFVCGPENPAGLHVTFRLIDDVCRGEFTPAAHHVGWSGITHGGLLYSVLDDVMANWLHLRGERGYTGRCQIRYRSPLPVGVTVDLEGRCVKRRGRLAVLRGAATRRDTGELVAETEATFAVEAPDRRGAAAETE